MALRTIDLGPVSSYAIAVEKGYTGTEAEWYELIHNVTSNAEAAASSASSAAQSAATAVQAVADVGTAKDAAIAAIQGEGSTQTAAVTAEGAAQIANVQAAEESAVDAVEAQQGTSEQAVYDKGVEQIAAVGTAGTTQIGLVQAEGATQIAAVEAKGEEVIESIPEDYSELTEEVGSLKSAVDEIDGKMAKSVTHVDLDDYTSIQTIISPSTGKWAGSSTNRIVILPIGTLNRIKITANTNYPNAVALLKTDSHTVGNYPDYATGSTRTVIPAGNTLELTVPDDAHYLYAMKTVSGDVYTPSVIDLIEYKAVPLVDTTLTQSGDAADAKTVGDQFGELTDAVGSEVVDSFTRTGSANALKTIAFPVTADVPIMFSWTSETGSGELNLYTRATYDGENLEQLKATAHPDTLYRVVPTQDAAYLRVSATASGTITAYDLNGLIGRMNAAENEIAILGQKAQNVPFVKFKFSDQMYDPSDIFGASGEIGDINAWSSNALAISKVHAAFDALCASGGAGYGYGERITGLYKESASDEALFDLTAPSYITQGVTQGDTAVLDIGTDTNGDAVTYNYTYESSTQPYDIRLYKFHDTNNALHSNTTDIPKKKLLLIGGVHGNEFCAPIDLYVFAKHLCTDYSNPDVYKLRSSFDIYIIPYVNGFGCQYQWSNSGTMTTGARCNGHLVDINRNCPTLGWVGPTGTAEQITAHFESKIANLALDTFAGPSNGSEFEGQLVKAVIDWLSPDVVIDHHHNSGNSPFYATAYDLDAGYIIYQAANDFACALSNNLPEYYGTGYNINQILGSDVSPATRAAANGHINTMAYECGVKMSAVNEMAQSIAYNNGVYDAETKAATKYSAVVFKVSEYSLLIEMLHLCQYAMEH